MGTTFQIPFFDNSLRIQYGAEGVTEITWQRKKVKSVAPQNAIERKIKKQINDYVCSGVHLKLDVDWSQLPGTPFQKQVWRAMAKIPFGKTKSYGEIAKAIKKPGAARAVGAACGKNPVLLAIPCHRVVGANGLGGFSGGGVAVKQQLLALEQDRYLT